MAHAPFTGLWCHADFLKLWTGQTISVFGSLVGRFAVSLTAILVLGASAFEMSLVRAADLVPAILFGLVAGVWVDRLRRRPIMIVADIGRAVALGWIPLAAWLGILRIEHLYVVMVVVSVLTLMFDVAYRSYLPALIRRDQLLEGNSKLQATNSVAEVTGFSLAGLFVQVLSAPMTILLDAISFVISAASLALIRRAEPPPNPPAERQSAWREIRAGLRLVGRDPVLRALAGLETTRSLFGSGIVGTLVVLFLVDELGLDPLTMGVLFSLGGISALGGAVIAERATRRWGVGPALLWGYVLFAISVLLIPLAGGPYPLILALLAMQQLLGDGAYMVMEISQTSLIQSSTPDRLLGRVNASLAFLGQIGMLAGVAMAGLLGELVGLRAALFVAAFGGIASAAWIVFSPVRHLREVPILQDSASLGET